MRATVFDLASGDLFEVNGPRSFEWAENGWSCDCNRARPAGEAGSDCRTHRYLVVDAVFDDPDDYVYSLRELNVGYPTDVVERIALRDVTRSECVAYLESCEEFVRTSDTTWLHRIPDIDRAEPCVEVTDRYARVTDGRSALERQSSHSVSFATMVKGKFDPSEW